MSGIFPKIPHFWLFPSPAPPVIEELLELRCGLLEVIEPFRELTTVWGRSKMCSVDLSDVTARSMLLGEIEIE